jgi:dihydropteroate synthase
MGVLNVTPDSFSDGSSDATDAGRAVVRGLEMWDDGADIIDVGGESTRPYAEPVSAAVEVARVVPVVRGLAAQGVVVSVDTMKAAVAAAAVGAGAEIINDVSGFRDPEMRRTAAETRAGVVVMHMRGTPQTMQDDLVYADVVAEVDEYLDRQVAGLRDAGVSSRRIVVDPGIGFGKTHSHSLELLRRLSVIADRVEPVLVGASRKGFVGAILEGAGYVTRPDERDGVSAVIAGIAVLNGASVVRAHDARATLEAVAAADAIVRAGSVGESQSSGEI